MEEVVYQVTIEALSPLNISSGVQGRMEKIAYTVKDRNSKSYIPGTTLKGLLRYHFSQLVGMAHSESLDKCQCDLCYLFGKPGYSPAHLFVDDFKLMKDGQQEVRSCNRIDRRRRVCVEGALFSKEVAYGTYEGNVTAYIENEGLKKELEAAIKLITQIGSGKSRGLGNVKVEVKEVKACMSN